MEIEAIQKLIEFDKETRSKVEAVGTLELSN